LVDLGANLRSQKNAPAITKPSGIRNRHPYVFTLWMAGGGVKPGLTYGESDDLGFNPAANPVHVHDYQATVLHLLGIDHTRLTYKFRAAISG